MVGRGLHKIIKRKPFVPLRMGLTDGRSVVIRHPDLVIVSDRGVFVGLGHLEGSPPLETPDRDTAVEDWLWISILHVASVEPVNGHCPEKKRRSRGRRTD